MGLVHAIITPRPDGLGLFGGDPDRAMSKTPAELWALWETNLTYLTKRTKGASDRKQVNDPADLIAMLRSKNVPLSTTREQ